MGHRKVVHVVMREPADPGVSPNATVGQLTVDIRIVWPPHVDPVDAWQLFQRAIAKAEQKVLYERTLREMDR